MANGFQSVQDPFGLGRLAQQLRLNRQEAAEAPIRAAQTELLQGKVQQQRLGLADLARQRQDQEDLRRTIESTPDQDSDFTTLQFLQKRNPQKAQQFMQNIFSNVGQIAKFNPAEAVNILNRKTGTDFKISDTKGDFIKLGSAAQGKEFLYNIRTGETQEFTTDAGGLTPEQRERELVVKEKAQEVRGAELKERRRETERKAGELKPTMQKILDTAQNQSFEAEKTANEFDLLVDDFEGVGFGGGVAASIDEFLKDALGTQDDVSALRRKFRGIRASQATKNLPPGPASDKDIALAISGFPPANAPAEVIASFLRGASKMARIDQAFQSFKAEYISENKSSAGLIRAWRENRDSVIDDALRDFRQEETQTIVVQAHPDFGDITEEDIQETMRANNLTREQVLQNLGGQ